MEEQQAGNDAESHKREVDLLQEESQLPLEELLCKLMHPLVRRRRRRTRWPC